MSQASMVKYWKAMMMSILIITIYDQAYGQRNVSINRSIEYIQNLYQAEQYELAYDSLLGLHDQFYGSMDIQGQTEILDYGIRLSFLAADWPQLDEFISEYYALDPYFSADILTESSTQLREYISNFVRTRSEQYVYVNKHRQNVDFIPASVTIYGKDDIERWGARNLLDLIRITPGFAELGDNNERMFGTRGSSGTSLQDVLILINGHRISDNLTNTNAPDWISLDYVEQIEIVRGPGSALYGGSAFSGVVNIITKNGRFKNFNELKVNLGTGNDFGNFDFENNTYHLNYQAGKKISNTEGIYLSATLFQSGGSEIDYSQSDEQPILPDTNGGATLREADLDGIEYINRYAPSYNLLLNYNRNSLQVTANAQSNTFIYSRPSSLNLWNSIDQDSLSLLRRRIDKRNFVQVEYDFLDNTIHSHNELRMKVSGDYFYKDFTTNLYSFGIDGNTRLVGDEYRGTVDIEYSTDSLLNFGSLKNHFLIGGEAYVTRWFYNYYTEIDTTMVLDKVGDQFTDAGESRNEYIAAAFIQTEQHLINDRLIATAGVRLNYHNIYSTLENFVWGEEYSPRFALVYLPKVNRHELHPFKFKLLYNSAFLPPPFLYRRGGIANFVGADSLRSQSVESGEFVVFGDLNKNFSYSASTYVNKIDESIVRVGSSYINQSTDQRVSGYEIELKYKSTSETFDWYSFINYSFTKQQDFKDSVKHGYLDVFNSNLYYSGDSLQRFPASHVNAGINATFKKKRIFNDFGEGSQFEKFTIGATAQWIGESTIESNYFINEDGLPETTTSAELQQIPSAMVFNALFKIYTDKFSVGASVYNLTNHQYYLPSAVSSIQRQRAEGRMIFLNFNYYFK